MATRAQIEANRRNGSLSKGPVSANGKTTASKNALKHGLLAHDLLLPEEDSEAFRGFSERLRAELRAESELECLLVERIIDCSWRLTRCGRIEAAVLIFEQFAFEARLETGSDEEDETAIDNAREAGLRAQAVLGEAFGSASKYFAILSRYEVAIERSLTKALHELQRLQAARQGREVPVPAVLDVNVHGIEPR